ncbi:MAG: GLPGLI family protein [Bacteroidales bacterium]|jgi:GLPGLI family protein|nr:GLPGLI family protein [Bacteroidales bacterium]
MMKHLFLKLLAYSCLVASSAPTGHAQQVSGTSFPPIKPVELVQCDTAYTRVYYEYAYKKDSLKQDLTYGQTLLLVGKRFLGFMDYYRWKFDRLNDSLYYAKASPVALMTQGVKIMANVNYKYPLVINRQKRSATVQVCSIGTYQYRDTLPALQWRLIDSDTIVAGVPCKKAACRYRGRTWLAWYAPAFALQAGPYLFGGLPGLIFDIKDTAGNYHFTLNGVENTSTGDKIYLHCSSNIVTTSRENVRRAVQNEMRDILKAFEITSPGIQFPEKMKRGDHSRPYNPIELE